jgi:methylmalonyl-CoA mutase
MTTAGFLAEFAPTTTQEWEEVIRKDLKGADYARKLLWQTGEGFSARPYYRSEDIAGLEQPNTAPGDFPYMRGTRSTPGWMIREEVVAVEPYEANRAALSAVAAGGEEIAFRAVQVANESDIALLLTNLENVPLHFENVDEPLLRLLLERLGKRQHGAIVSTGWNPASNLEFATEIVTSPPPSLRPFTIHGETFEQSGANASEEVGLALAAAVDFMAEMQQRNLPIDRAANSIAFSFAIGANFFIQIAKFRAFRMLWSQVVESFGGSRDHARARVHARTSSWNKTIYDPHVNILRATTEAMSAVIGSVDSISIASFDACYKVPDAASQRLARNAQLILRHEAQLARVADPGGGSYFLEVLTDSIARRSWELMQEVERSGGFRKASESGMIAQKLEASRTAREQAVASRKSVLAGTNRYANPAEDALSRIDPAHTDSTRRGAQPYEELRLRSERHAILTGTMPRILLAEIGDLKMRSARSQFAADIFACAGLTTVSRQFSDPVQIALCEADLIVLCSADGEYLKHATDLFAGLKNLNRDTPVAIAGNPDCAEELTKLGIADFIHLRSNPVEFLTQWQQRLGIKD